MAAPSDMPWHAGSELRRCLLLLAIAAWEGWALREARRNHEALAAVPDLGPVPDARQGDPLPISVIVPARNEAQNLPALLDSLNDQRQRAAEVLVVDDQSTDGTSNLALAAGATAIESPGPPANWTGKNYACHLGSRHACQPWLLFLDADVMLEPGALCSALAYATDHELDGLSLLPRQRCVSFWERMLLPYAFAHYFAGVDPDSALANGQWILISAAAYAQSGGHAAVSDSVIDDVALGRQCRKTGVRVQLARGESIVSVRMYRNLAGIWEGFSKNAFRFVAISPAGGARTVASALAAASLPGVLWTVGRFGGRASWAAAALVYGVETHGLLYWQRRFNAGPVSAPLYPLSAIVFQCIALNSAARVLSRRGVVWKGRTYR